jgi:hypothetical protein
MNISTSKYQYYKRQGYGSSDFLIQFISDVADESFLQDLINTLSEINLKLTDYVDVWYNDEIQLFIKSDIGEFILSKDIWDFAFITSEQNNTLINSIDSILSRSNRYEKLD